jgi:hypothetical protein
VEKALSLSRGKGEVEAVAISISLEVEAMGPLFEGPPPEERLLESVERGIEEILRLGEEEVLRQIEGAEPYPPIFTGGFMRSIFSEARGPVGEVFQGLIGSAAPYAPVIEFGRAPGNFPPIGPLRVWARRRLGSEDLAWPVAMKIQKKGISARRVFEKALPAIEARAGEILEEAIAEDF